MIKPTDKYKVCTHCEGRIPVEVVICPYCATQVSDQDASNTSRMFSPPKPSISSDNLAGLYNPPYASSRLFSNPEEKKKSVETPPPASTENTLLQPAEKSEILPISLLVVGSNLMLFGLLQALLSKDGVLQLEWNSSFWYLYTLLAIPLLWFGIKSLKAPSSQHLESKKDPF